MRMRFAYCVNGQDSDFAPDMTRQPSAFAQIHKAEGKSGKGKHWQHWHWTWQFERSIGFGSEDACIKDARASGFGGVVTTAGKRVRFNLGAA